MIKINTKYEIGETVFFLHKDTIINGEIVSVNFSEISRKSTQEYKKTKIKGVYYGVKICIKYFGNVNKVVEKEENRLFSKGSELAQNLLDVALEKEK